MFNLGNVSTPEGDGISGLFTSEEPAIALNRLDPGSPIAWSPSSRSLYSAPGQLRTTGYAISLHPACAKSKSGSGEEH